MSVPSTYSAFYASRKERLTVALNALEQGSPLELNALVLDASRHVREQDSAVAFVGEHLGEMVEERRWITLLTFDIYRDVRIDERLIVDSDNLTRRQIGLEADTVYLRAFEDLRLCPCFPCIASSLFADRINLEHE